MLAEIYSSGVLGVDGYLVEVEVEALGADDTQEVRLEDRPHSERRRGADGLHVRDRERSGCECARPLPFPRLRAAGEARPSKLLLDDFPRPFQ